MWKQAVRTAVSSITAVIVSNMVDNPGNLNVVSWAWWRHVLIAAFAVTLLNEARYFKNWADTSEIPKGGQGGTATVGIFLVSFLVSIALNHLFR